MANTLADFPADRFEIGAWCDACGHQGRVPIKVLAQDLTIDAMRARLRCRACDARDVQISIIWIAAGGYAHSAQSRCWAGRGLLG